MKNELFSIGPLTVYGYGTMIAIGIFAGYFTADYQTRKQGLSRDALFSLVVWCVLGGLLGAKVLYWITEWKYLLQNPQGFLDLADGFVVYGGILGGIGAGWLWTRKNQISFWQYADILLPSVALAQGFGRIGCLLAGCCYGKETSGLLAITFSHSHYAPNGVPLIPTQIYSSVLDFCNFFFLTGLLSRKKTDGEIAAWYLIFYSIGRFCLEFFRGDLIRGSVGVLSTSQFISLFILAGGVWLVLSRRRLHKMIKNQD